MKDGWKVVKTYSEYWGEKDYEVYVEDRMIRRALKEDSTGCVVSASVYKVTRTGLINVCPVRYETARRGLKAGTYCIR